MESQEKREKVSNLTEKMNILISKLKEISLTIDDPNLLDSMLNKIENTIDSYYSQLIYPIDYLFDERVRENEKKLIKLLIEVSKKRGATPVFISIIGYLLIHRSGLTQQQLKELTGYSIGSISTALNNMENVGIVKKTLIKGFRTYLYSFGGNLTDLASNISYRKIEINKMAMAFVKSKLDELMIKTNQNKKGYKILLERINELMNFLKIREKIIEIVNKEFPFQQFDE